MPVSHLRKPFDPVQLRKIAIAMELRRRELGADLVVVRGLSGTLVASAMNVLFETPIAIVRKPNEQSHGWAVELIEERPVDNYWGYEAVKYNDWIIIDDLISSGRTVNSIIEAVDEHKKTTVLGLCVGILLYHNDEKEEDMHHYNEELAIPVFQIGKV